MEIAFDAPEGCSGAEVFFGSLRSRTNRVRRASGTEPRTTLQVRLTRQPGRVLGELRIVDDRGGTDSRKVQGAGCEEVVQALSLTAALALDPAALLTTPPAEPVAGSGGPAGAATAAAASTSATAGATAAGTGTPGTPSASPAATPDATRAEAAVKRTEPEKAEPDEAERQEEVAPRPVPALELGLGPVALALLSESWGAGGAIVARKTLGGEGILRPTLGLAALYVRNDVGWSPDAALASLAALGATACPARFTASILTIEPCALVLGGWLSVTGRQLTYTSTADRFWLSAGATLRIAAFLGAGLSLALEGGASLVLLERRFYVTVPGNVVAETPTFSPVVGLGLTYGL